MLGMAFLFSLAVPFPSMAQGIDAVIDIEHAPLTATVYGSQNTEIIIALPGSGADNSRYRELGQLLGRQGFRVVALNQRGSKGSNGELQGLSLRDFAVDVVAVIDSFGLQRAHLMDWAMGNRISRATATHFPERVATVTLLAAGGLVPATAPAGDLNRLLSDATLPDAEKFALARRTLFSPATDDALVQEFIAELSYWPEGREAQTSANRATPETQWWSGGVAPMLIIQGLDDTSAPVGNGRQMKEAEGDRVTLVEIADASHLMTFEKPQETSEAVIAFL
jgi:pimeloyl-ACP methyl ester carboxylesterase